MYFTPPLAKLIEEFQRFPGVGPKFAQRMAFYVLGMSSESVKGFAHALLDAKKRVKNCSICFHLSAENPCEICTNDRRDKTIMCVVAESRDVIALERSREYKGSCHVLTGLISPLDGKGPDQLSIRELLNRIVADSVTEAILAINPTIEGDATVLYLTRIIKPLGCKISRIAFGLPVGAKSNF
jgi:recombination protein RecR